MTERTPPEPTAWIVLRGDLLTAAVGPFKTEDDANAWQARDSSIHGEPENCSTWPLYSPEDAAAFATAMRSPEPVR